MAGNYVERARKTLDEVDDRHKYLMGYLYGVLAQNGAKGAVTGMDKLTGVSRRWHVTDHENVQDIMRDGLLADKASDPHNLTHQVLGREIPHDELSGKVYLAKNKTTANGVKTIKSRMPLSDIQRILDIKIPYDEYRSMRKTVNPETGGSFRKYLSARIRRGLKAAPNGNPLAVRIKSVLSAPFEYAQLENGTDTLAQDLPAKYIVGSNAHAVANAGRSGLRDWLRYVAKHPFRFSSGVAGKAALGSMTALSLARLYGIIAGGHGTVQKSAAADDLLRASYIGSSIFKEKEPEPPEDEPEPTKSVIRKAKKGLKEKRKVTVQAADPNAAAFIGRNQAVIRALLARLNARGAI